MARKTYEALIAEVATLFPDNTQELITPANVRAMFSDFLDSTMPAYGVLQITALKDLGTVNAAGVVLGFDSVYVAQAPEFVAVAANGTVQRAQTECTNQIIVQMSLECPSNTETQVVLYANGVATTYQANVQGAGSGRPVTINLVAFNYSAVPVTYHLLVKAEAGSHNVAVSKATFQVNAIPVRLGG